MLRLILIILAIQTFSPLAASSKECSKKHPIYCQILEIRPFIRKSYAMDISNAIHKYSKQFCLEPSLMVAIMAQESMFKMGAVGYGGNDYGLMQINGWNIDNIPLDKKKIMQDIDYAVFAGALVLSFFKQYDELEPKTWWTRYNTGNDPKKAPFRDKYHRDVCRWYKGRTYCEN